MRANDAFVLLLKMALTADGGSDAYEERFETTWEPVELPSELEQTQAFANVAGRLPLKTAARRYLHMTETEIAEMVQDAQDTSFSTVLAQQQSSLADSSKTVDDAMGASYLDDSDGLTGDTAVDDGDVPNSL